MHSQIRILIFIGFSLLLMQEALHHINKKLKQQKHDIQPTTTAIQVIPKFTPFNIIKLTSIDDTYINVENAINYHLNPSILLDENEYQQSYQPFRLTYPEQLGIKFQEPQIVNMIKFYIKVQKLGYDINSCDFDNEQINSITLQAIDVNRKVTLFNSTIFNKNVVIKTSIHNRKYLQIIKMLKRLQEIYCNLKKQKYVSQCIPHISVPYKQY